MKLSIVLATRNEEENIARCLQSVTSIADEILIFDEHSTDKTVQIAKTFNAKIASVDHQEIFHVTKQRAIDAAQGDWILQLDADEVVTPELSQEIKNILEMDQTQIRQRRHKDLSQMRLLDRHLNLLVERDGKMGTNSDEIVAFLIPRVNMFLGKPLVHGGVYPDGVIRLIKRGKAYLPAKSVHEQMVVEGRVAWLFSPLEHWDSPTLFRYLSRLNRYTDLHANELKSNKISLGTFSLLKYITYEPVKAFVLRYIRHRGYKDGLYGFLWAMFSAWHYPIAYFKYATA